MTIMDGGYANDMIYARDGDEDPTILEAFPVVREIMKVLTRLSYHQ